MTKPTLESIAKALIINEKHEVLILTVGEYKARPDKSFKPDLPGGIVDPGETELVAVVREIKEETAIDVTATQCVLAYAKTEFFESEIKSVSKFLYIVRLNHTPTVTISWEHAEYAWVPIEDVLTSVELRPFYEEAVRYCIEHRLIN